MSATPLSTLRFVPILFYSQLLVRIPYPTSKFSGQTIIVTGSNTGLGLEAARHLVRLGASKVILAVRTKSKGEAAAADILTSTGATKTVIEVWELDLSSYDSIKAFGDRVQALERLDALIQNAGVLSLKFSLVNAEEGHIAVNVIGAMLLGLVVLPKLRESAAKFNTRTRLSFVGSDSMYVAKAQSAKAEGSLFAAVRSPEGIDMGDQYASSKLFLFYAVREMAARSPVTPASNVIINCTTPGLCDSGLFRDDLGWIEKLGIAALVFFLARTTEVGGRTLVDGVRPDIDVNTHGAFLMDCKVASNGASVENAKGQELGRRLNAELFAKLEEISPGVTKVLR